jgi:hypothetical protein
MANGAYDTSQMRLLPPNPSLSPLPISTPALAKVCEGLGSASQTMPTLRLIGDDAMVGMIPPRVAILASLGRWTRVLTSGTDPHGNWENTTPLPHDRSGVPLSHSKATVQLFEIVWTSERRSGQFSLGMAYLMVLCWSSWIPPCDSSIPDFHGPSEWIRPSARTLRGPLSGPLWAQTAPTEGSSSRGGWRMNDRQFEKEAIWIVA